MSCDWSLYEGEEGLHQRLTPFLWCSLWLCLLRPSKEGSWKGKNQRMVQMGMKGAFVRDTLKIFEGLALGLNRSCKWTLIYCHLLKWLFPKIGVPPIIHFNRVFHYFHHPFWSALIFGNTQIYHLEIAPIYGPTRCLVKATLKTFLSAGMASPKSRRRSFWRPLSIFVTWQPAPPCFFLALLNTQTHQWRI